MAYLKRELGLFDEINPVIGTIVGADISSQLLWNGYLGLSSIFAYLITGLMVFVIALCFECSYFQGSDRFWPIF